MLKPSTALSAPNDLVTFSSFRSATIAPSRDRLQLVGDRNRRRLGVVDDNKLVFVLATAAAPLAAGQGRLGDVLEGRQLAELDLADDGVELGRCDRVTDRRRLAEIL